VDTPAGFPPAKGDLKAYFAREMVYPETAKQQNIQGTVYVQCTIMRDGSMRDVKLLKGVSPELDQEALRLVRNMKGWVPGKNNGQVVNSKTNLVVRFRLP
jgi:protein TonB